jgi:hypothetical protein
MHPLFHETDQGSRSTLRSAAMEPVVSVHSVKVDAGGFDGRSPNPALRAASCAVGSTKPAATASPLSSACSHDLRPFPALMNTATTKAAVKLASRVRPTVTSGASIIDSSNPSHPRHQSSMRAPAQSHSTTRIISSVPSCKLIPVVVLALVTNRTGTGVTSGRLCPIRGDLASK